MLYDVESYPVIEVQVGQYGLLTAKDRHPLREGQFYADERTEADFEEMLNASNAGYIRVVLAARHVFLG